MKFIIFTDPSQIEHVKKDTADEVDKMAGKIMEEIQRVSSHGEILTLIHSRGTNVTELDTRWKGSKLKKNLRMINNTQGCGGIMLNYNPINEVEDAVRNHD